MKRTILAVVVATALAFVGVFAVVLYVGTADARALEGQQAVRILVAATQIPAGTTGAEVREGGYLAEVVMPASSVPEDAMSAIDADLDELALTSEAHPRQVLLRGAFGPPAAPSGGLEIPDGKVAVTVELSAAARVAGFVRPGSKIAIFDTFTVADPQLGRVPSGDTEPKSEYAVNHATRVLLTDIEVLTLGSHRAPEPPTATGGDAADDGAATNENASVLVTVAVTQEQAEKLVHGTQTGTLYLALLDDSSQVRPSQGVDNHSLFD